MLLWEIMTLGGTPYPTIAMPQLFDWLKEGYRMDAPHNCPKEVYDLMTECWQANPDARPNFTSIVNYLDQLLTYSAGHGEVNSNLLLFLHVGSMNNRRLTAGVLGDSIGDDGNLRRVRGGFGAKR